MISSRAFDYRHDDVQLTGWLAQPSGPGPHPAVMVMHSALGISDVVRGKADELAAMGYVALATDMYGSAPDDGDPKAYGALFKALIDDPDLLRARIRSAFDAIRSLPGVDAGRIAAIGYCFGGQCVLELARSGAAVRSVVSFHGLLTSAQPAERGAVQAKVLAITGALDPYAPAEHVQAFQKEMTEAGVDWQVTVYGTGWHAFTDPVVGRREDLPGLRYDAMLDRLSWAQATEFLSATLEPG
jgi:dienelactone hydrolase